MRQRALVIIKPNQIPRIDPAVAYFASEKVIGLGNATPVGALAEHRPARSRFIEWHDRCHLAHLTKKIRPRNYSRGPIRMARGTSARCLSIYGIANIAAVKLRPSHKHDNEPHSD
jgi:hypothetical protein